MTPPAPTPPRYPRRPKPEEDIGPLFRAYGGLLALMAALGIAVIRVWRDQPITTAYLYLVGIIVALVLALWRPRWFDHASKWLADKLPMFSFSKGGKPGGEG